MTYFDAIDGFRPQSDTDAALKLALESIFSDERFAELAALLTPGAGIDGLEGEPGWLLERRGPGDADWPADADFKASVDQDSFALAHPECHATTAELMHYVERLTADQARLSGALHPELARLREWHEAPDASGASA